MDAISTRLDHQEKGAKTFESNLQSKVTAIQTDLNQQVSALSKSFEESLTRAMRKQDKQLGDSFEELKQTLLASPGPHAKRSKTDKDKDNE